MAAALLLLSGRMSMFVLVAPLLHAALFFCVLDMYFRSPIDSGIPAVDVGIPRDAASASRVVLIVADGLRADTLFRFAGRDERYHSPPSKKRRERGDVVRSRRRENKYQADATTWGAPEERTSFLREVMEDKGAWGIAHTRVPTETRPGHVAIIAGLYEDVSAVTRGWRENPVDFDTVFNRSSHTWAFGSPDITRMFAKGAPNVVDYHYSSAEEDFAARDLSALDSWVFDRVADMLGPQTMIRVSEEKLRADKNVFFLHLLGLDSNGHAHRPMSPEYVGNAASVDRGVRRIHDLFEAYFPDKKTAYVFMSDHGMSSKGNHGDGNPENTRTPFVAWGCGVAKARRADKEIQAKSFSAHTTLTLATGFSPAEEARLMQDWGLDHLVRRDIEQADAAPLMATLLGIPIPVNSVGTMPLSYLHHGKRRAAAFLRNAMQLKQSVDVKEERKRAATLSFRFRSFPGFRRQWAPRQIDNAKRLAGLKKYFDAEEICRRVIVRCHEGLRYYQQYDRTMLGFLVSAGFIGWVLVCAKSALMGSVAPREPSRAETLAFRVAMTFFAILVAVIVLEGRPFQYLLYVCLPLFCWRDVLYPGRSFAHWSLRRFRAIESPIAKFELAALGALCYAATQIMFAGYSNRTLYFILMVCMAAMPWSKRGYAGVPALKKATWALSCILLGCFLFLPLDWGIQPRMLALGCVLSAALVCFRARRARSASVLARCGLLLAACMVALRTDSALAARKQVHVAFRLLAWFTCIASIAVPRAFPLRRIHGSTDLGALVPSYALLSVHYEVCFLVAFSMVLDSWIGIETALAKVQKRRPARATLHDLRAALVFVVLSKVAFFGTGNVASMGSFELASTFRFTTVFSPFTMAALLVLKVMIPYFLLCDAARSVVAARRAMEASRLGALQLFCIVLALYDLCALSLFFSVRDRGSWKDIGNSIGKYGLSMAQLVFIPLVFAASAAVFPARAGKAA